MSRKITLTSALVLGTLALLGAGCVKTNLTNKNEAALPSISVSNQAVKNNQVVIDKASIGDEGWIVIHTKENGQPGTILGYTSLASGSDSKIKITIDKTKISESLIAMLHYDRGQKGTFEFPGADGPVIKDQKVIMQEFSIKNYADLTKDSEQNNDTAIAATVSARKEFVITAKQWSFSPSEIKVKKGDTVVLKLKTVDVAHSYTIPEFGINVAIKPGETAVAEFVADKTGTFTSSCTTYCGVGHAGMKGTIIVE